MACKAHDERLPGIGCLKNGNRTGNPLNAPRCGARNRQGLPCRSAAMKGKRRCRLHGGKSTGPRTPEGIAAIKTSRTKHGRYSKEAVALRRTSRARLRELRDLLNSVGGN